MYSKSSSGFTKHTDFILLDVIVLEFVYMLAYLTRHGTFFRHLRELYINGGLVLAVAALFCSVFMEPHKNILKRGYMKEFLSVTEQIVITAGSLLLYLFLTQTSGRFSRSVIGYYILFGYPILYAARIIWKKLILFVKARSSYSARRMLIVTTKELAEEVVTTIRAKSLGEIEPIGLVLIPSQSENENNPATAVYTAQQTASGQDATSDNKAASDQSATSDNWTAFQATSDHAATPDNSPTLQPVSGDPLTPEDIAAIQADPALADLYGTSPAEEQPVVGDRISGVPIVATMEHLTKYMSHRTLDEVMIYLPMSVPVPEKLLKTCAIMGITTHVRLQLTEDRGMQQTVEKVGGVLVLTESMRIVTAHERILKRLMDIAGSLVGIAITLLILPFVAVAILISDPGPIFFTQVRKGENGRNFRIIKFRTMYKDAEKRKAELLSENEVTGAMFKMEADPRIIGSGPDGTRHGVGWFLRKTSLDEFPQFFNVLIGQMSLVGTRPPTVDEWDLYEAHHRARMAVKPGITGLWQVSGRSDITDFEEVIRLDTQYINEWSIAEDLRILVKTVKVVLTGEGSK